MMMRDPAMQPAAEHTSGEAEGLPFLSRWSRRKRGLEVAEPLDVQPVAVVAPVAEAVEADLDDPLDLRTGKRRSELTDEDMPDIETLNADSDVSMFMAKQVSSALRTRALSKIFMSPKYNVYCLCAEYADDYTNFAPLGDIVPHDLKSAIAREAGKLYARLTGQGVTVSQEELEGRIAAQFRGEKTPDLEAEYLARAERDGTLQQVVADDESPAGNTTVAPMTKAATDTEAT